MPDKEVDKLLDDIIAYTRAISDIVADMQEACDKYVAHTEQVIEELSRGKV